MYDPFELWLAQRRHRFLRSRSYVDMPRRCQRPNFLRRGYTSFSWKAYLSARVTIDEQRRSNEKGES